MGSRRIKIRLVTAVVCYAIALTLSYRFAVSPRYSYLGYTSSIDSVAILVFLGIAGGVIAGLAMPVSIVSFGSSVRATLLVIVWLPSVVIGTQAREGVSAHWVGFLIVSLGLTVAATNEPKAALRIPPVLNMSPSVAAGLLLISGLSMMSVILLAAGLSNPIPLLLDPLGENLYEARYASRSVIPPGSIANTLLFSGTRVVFPATLIAGLVSRRKLLVLTSVASQLLCFGITAHKTPVAFLILTLIWFSTSGRQSGHVERRKAETFGVMRFLTFAVTVAHVIYLLGERVPASLLTRRTLSAQGLNSRLYFEYFSENPTFQLRHSILGWMGPSNYSESKPAFVVGEYFFGSADIAANASALVDGYANFRTAGMVGSALVLWVFVSVVQSLSIALPVEVVFLATGPMLLAIANTSILTIMTTHGGVLVPPVLLMLRSIVPGTGRSAGLLQAADEGEVAASV